MTRRRTLQIGFLIIWWLAAATLKKPHVLPGPLAVFSVLIQDPSIYRYAAASLVILLMALLFSFLAAGILSYLAGRSAWVQEMMDLLLGFFDPLPGIALLPLLLLWMGIGSSALFFLVVHAMFWPLYLAFDKGIKLLPRVYLEVATTFGFGKTKRLLTVILPGILPSLIVGARQAFGRGWRAVIAAEMFFGAIGGSGGLGFYIVKKRAFFDVPALTAALFLISFLGILSERAAFTALEEATVKRWYG